MVDEMIIVYACKVKRFSMNLFTKNIRLFVNNETSHQKQTAVGLRTFSRSIHRYRPNNY